MIDRILALVFIFLIGTAVGIVIGRRRREPPPNPELLRRAAHWKVRCMHERAERHHVEQQRDFWQGLYLNLQYTIRKDDAE